MVNLSVTTSTRKKVNRVKQRGNYSSQDEVISESINVMDLLISIAEGTEPPNEIYKLIENITDKDKETRRKRGI